MHGKIYLGNMNTIFVIRSAGERTTDLCRFLITQQNISNEDIILINEVPFSKALRKSFEIGIKSQKAWLFCIDADVLLRKNAINILLELASKEREDVCEIQGYVFDKFFAGPRPGGIHLYRTSLLNELMNCIPAEGENIRPEYHTLLEMKKRGFPYKVIPYIVGLHDYEQYYADIYRKCFMHGVKHIYYAEYFSSQWKAGSVNEPDFEIALKAFADGIKFKENTYTSKAHDIHKEGFENLETNEKSELRPEVISFDSIEQTINNWIPSEMYLKYFNHVHLHLTEGDLVERIKESFSKRGCIRTFILYLGRTFNKIGNFLISKVD